MDAATGQVGPADPGLDEHVARALVEVPDVEPEQSPLLKAEIVKLFPERTDLHPRALLSPIVSSIVPTPCLTLNRVRIRQSGFPPRRDMQGPRELLALVVELSFSYDGQVVKQRGGAILTRIDGEQIVRIPRRQDLEAAALHTLDSYGFKPFCDAGYGYYLQLVGVDRDSPALFVAGKPATPDQMTALAQAMAPELREAGWEVQVDPYVVPVDFAEGSWEADVTESSGLDWFSVNLGVIVDGERFDLRPILLKFLEIVSKEDWEWFLKGTDAQSLMVPLPDGRQARMPVARTRMMLNALHDLFAVHESGRIAAAAAPILADLGDQTWLSWRGGDAMKDIGRRLRDFKGLASVPAPAGLKANLRPYQLEGLSWLDFLAEYGFSGILADDMGLGKTVEALAHILAVKDAGKLDRPCIVVAPTSLMPNWQAEAAKWAPSLKVLTLHGPARSAHFDKMGEHDLVLTTYALLARDQDALLNQEFSLAILDEAQNIKNPKTATAHIACRLSAKRRLCMTGTPMENHLGELWSLFRFLMPGFLGSEAQFRKTFRTPIESQSDPTAREALRRRIRPFLLRRTKDEVAQDLPTKTEIVERLELDGPQRDLYETVRLAMHD